MKYFEKQAGASSAINRFAGHLSGKTVQRAENALAKSTKYNHLNQVRQTNLTNMIGKAKRARTLARAGTGAALTGIGTALATED